MLYKDLNQDTLKEASGILRALAHPLRVSLLNYIESHQPAQVYDIHTDLCLDQSITSQHLKILRDTGLVTTQRKGKSIFYQIDRPSLMRIIAAIQDFDASTLAHRKKRR